MTSESDGPTGDVETDGGQANRESGNRAAKQRHEDPAAIDRDDGRYDDRHAEAREAANSDDHRDEEPHS